MIGDKPPVPITFAFSPNSFLNLDTKPVTKSVYPNTSPDCKAAVVFLPIGLSGATSSTLRSWDVFRNNASADIFTPGTIAPPTYSLLLEIASKTVAVPKSTMIKGAP